MPSKRTNHLTAAELALRDRLYRDLVLECVRLHGFKKALGCLHLASDIASAAIVERRRSQGKQS